MSKAKRILLGYVEVIVVFLIICAMLVLGSVFSAKLGLWGTVVTELIMLAVLFLIIRLRREPLGQRFPMEGPPLGSLVSSLWLALGGYFLLSAAGCFMAAFFPSLTNTTDAYLYDNFMQNSSALTVVIAVVAVPAVCEELIFRGYFLNKLLSFHRRPFMPIAVSAALFAALHFDLYKFPITFIMGAVFGYVAYKTRSVWLPIVFHMINNALAVVELYSMNAPLEDDTLIAVIDDSNYVYLGIAALAIASGLLFSGLRRFGTINPKRWMRVLCPIVCVVVVIFSVSGFYSASTETRLDAVRLVEYPQQSEYSESFTVEKNSYCSVAVAAFHNYGVEAEFTITDSNGEIKLEASGENCSVQNSLVLAPGEYTLTCTFGPTEENTLPSFDVLITAKVIETYEIAEEN